MKEKIEDKKLREFGFLIGFGVPLIIGLIIPLVFGHEFREWTLKFSLPFIFLGILKPSLLYYPYKLWMSIGHFLGWINSRIIFGLTFIIILIPLSVILKTLGYDPLDMKRNNLKTYRKDKINYKINLKKPF